MGAYPTGCDRNQLAVCDYEYLQCKLFSGPAGDLPTLCACGKEYYGKCVRDAGCMMSKDDGSFSNTTGNYFTKKCVDDILINECPEPLTCSVNCASDGPIDVRASKILPINNYGRYYLRIRSCIDSNVHPQQFSRYSIIDNSGCKSADEFVFCSRFIPPMTFVPVAVDIATTYIEIDSCTRKIINNKETYECSHNPPYNFFSSRQSFPVTFDVEPTTDSICRSNDHCLGTFCDSRFRPPICSPITLKHVYGNGKDYFSDPYIS